MKRYKTTTRLTWLPTLLLIAGVAQPVHARRVPPPPQLSAQEQVARATDVALVWVVRALPQPTPAPRRPSDTPAWAAAHQG